MDKPEQLGDAHESLAALLLAIDRRTLIRIMAAAVGVDPGELSHVGGRDPRIQIPGLHKPGSSKIVDGIHTVHSTNGGISEFWLIEVELSWDRRKRRRWSLYLVAFEHELDADGQLAVFSPVPAMRERIRAKLIPRMRIKPILLEPDHIEPVRSWRSSVAYIIRMNRRRWKSAWPCFGPRGSPFNRWTPSWPSATLRWS